MRLWDKNLIFIWSGFSSYVFQHFQLSLRLKWGQCLDSQVRISHFAEWSFCVCALWWESDRTGLCWDHPEEFSVKKICQCSVPCSLQGSVWRRIWLSVTSWFQQETTTNLNLARSRLGRSSLLDWGSLPCSGCVWTRLFWAFLVCLPSLCWLLCCKKEKLLVVTLQDLHAPWDHTGDPSQEFQCPQLLPSSPSWWQTLLTCYISKAIYAPSQASLSSSTSITVFPQNLLAPH